MGFLDSISEIVSGLGAIANPFGAPAVGQWNLSSMIYTDTATESSIDLYYEKAGLDKKGQYTGLEQATDSGGRRIAKYEYPYRDGQKLKDLGRKGETYVFNLKFWGDNYQIKFKEFLDVVVNSGNSGYLTHPVRSAAEKGTIPVRFESYEFVHTYNEWNAVTIKATFLEDQTDVLATTNTPALPADSAFRNALQNLVDAQKNISNLITGITALVLLPKNILASLRNRLDSIVGSFSRMLAQIAATFSGDQVAQQIASDAARIVIGMPMLTAGYTLDNTSSPSTTVTGSTTVSQLPPTFQIGYSPETLAAIQTQLSNFITENKVTPQQAVFVANQVRGSVSAAIAEANTLLGTYPQAMESLAEIVYQYKILAIAAQAVVEASIQAQQQQVTTYTVQSPKSLRAIAFELGFSPEVQNIIENLNPYLGSVNYVPRGTILTVPVA